MPGFGLILRLLTPRPFSAHRVRKRGIAMDKFARAFMSLLLVAVVGLGAGCGSGGGFDNEKFWEKQITEQPGGP